AARTSSFSLGLAGGANVKNGDLLGNVVTLSLGIVGDSSIRSIGKVATLTAKSWNSGTLQAVSFGTINMTGDAKLGIVGDFNFVTLTATGNAGGTTFLGLGSLTVAGSVNLGDV